MTVEEAHLSFLRKSAWPASRSEALTVAVGFSARIEVRNQPRRVATLEERGCVRSTNRSTLQWRYVQHIQRAGPLQPAAIDPADTVAVRGCVLWNAPAAVSAQLLQRVLQTCTRSVTATRQHLKSCRFTRRAGTQDESAAIRGLKPTAYHRASLRDTEDSAVTSPWL
jgi:hypothetical protein